MLLLNLTYITVFSIVRTANYLPWHNLGAVVSHVHRKHTPSVWLVTPSSGSTVHLYTDEPTVQLICVVIHLEARI